MSTKFEIERDSRTDEVRFRGSFSPRDVENLDGLDLRVVQDCQGEGRSASDYLLALEIIFRRAEEALARRFTLTDKGREMLKEGK